ncbi:MAG: NRDE family protein [Pseudohongiellaceae bacterium]
MCLIIVAYRADPRFPLVVAANRDEFFTRPTAQADFWQTASGSRILAGKDLQAGGTGWALPQRPLCGGHNIRDRSRRSEAASVALTSSYWATESRQQNSVPGSAQLWTTPEHLLVGDASSWCMSTMSSALPRCWRQAFMACPMAA